MRFDTIWHSMAKSMSPQPPFKSMIRTRLSTFDELSDCVGELVHRVIPKESAPHRDYSEDSVDAGAISRTGKTNSGALLNQSH